MPIQRQVVNKLHTIYTLAEAGIIRPVRPDRLVGLASALIRFGPTPAAGYTAASLRYPAETAIIDELGTLTFREVHERSNALANGMADDGVQAGDNVGIMCRNHRGFIEATGRRSRSGAGCRAVSDPRGR